MSLAEFSYRTYSYRRENKEKAKQLMIDAANKGYVPAQYMLSRIYGSDAYMYGVKGNKNLEHQWLKKAAENGHIFAQTQLDIMLERNNEDEAVLWLTKAAEQGCPQACIELSRIIYNTKKDKKEPIEWLKIAAENGTPILAESYLNEIEDGSGCI